MKQKVTTFVSMKAALRELEPFIRNGTHLETGQPFKVFGGLRSREVLANWLLCAALNFDHGKERMQICTDPNGGDGIIYDKDDKNSYNMEHVLVSRRKAGSSDTQTLILNAINSKRTKGRQYAVGKSLIVFLNAKSGSWEPNRVARNLPSDLYFNEVWVVGLNNVDNGEYIYNVVSLDQSDCTIWQVKVRSDFIDWEVERE